MEYIDIDHRDKNFNKNEQGQETGLDAILQSYTKPRTNDAGLDLNPIDRLLNFCEYLSYITDEHLLNSAIKYVKTEVLLNNFDTDFDTLKQPLNREKHSDEDLIKIKAIIFSLQARFEIYKVVFNPSYINLPFFHIEFKNRIIEHNLEFAKGVILRNNDIDYKEQIKTLSLEDAKRLYNLRIENLEDLEYKHDTDISSKTIKYLKSNKKRLIETKKSELETPQQSTQPEKNLSEAREGEQDDTENDFLLSTIEDFLDPISELMIAIDHAILVNSLKTYFDTGAFPILTKKINIVGKPNMKAIGWIFNRIFESQGKGVELPLLHFCKNNVSLFKNVAFDENNYLRSNLYNYLNTKTKYQSKKT